MKISTIAVVTALAFSASNLQAANLKTSGFFTGGASGADGEYSFSRNTKIGVQVDAAINTQVFGTLQVVNRDNLSYPDIGRDTVIEYGFIGYKATDSVTVRAGRLRFPFFMLSEYVEVGNIVPWIEAPQSVYRTLPTNAYDGIDVSHTGSFGDFSYVASAFTGTGDAPAQIDALNIDVKMDNAKGGNVTIAYDDWNLRLSYGEANVSLPVDALTGIGMQQNFQLLTNGAAQAAAAAEQLATIDPVQAAILQQQAIALGEQAGQLGFLIQELPTARKMAIMNLGFNGYVTDELSLMGEYSKRASDNLIVNDHDGYYIAATYQVDDYRITGTYSFEDSFRFNNSINNEEEELILTVAYEMGNNWLAKAEVAQVEMKTNGSITNDFTRWGLTLNYVF